MSGSINKAIILGFCGKDPDIRATQNGNEIASFSIATSESWKDKNTGERRENTQWHNVVIFNENLVKVAKNYIRKGSKVYVEGAIQTRKWVDKDGVGRYSTEIVLQGFGGQIVLLDAKPADGDDSPAPARTASRQAKPAQANLHDDLDDEIPF